MAGAKTGIATHINEIEPQVHLRHCHGHALQLNIGETIKIIKIMKSTLDAAFELNEIEPHVHLRHCHGHALQLTNGETIKTIKIMKSTLDAAFELNKLVKYSIKKSNTL